VPGVVGSFVLGLPAWRGVVRGQLKVLECTGVVGETPVGEDCVCSLGVSPSSMGLVESRVNLPGPPGKPEYFLVTDSG
jgi:hypothetical protein